VISKVTQPCLLSLTEGMNSDSEAITWARSSRPDRPRSHHKLIAFDKAVRTRVGGGQAILLTERDQFSYLYSAFLLPDGVPGGFGKWTA
jgi:hypothetical protein